VNDDTATPHAAAHVLLRKDNTIAFVLRSATGWMDGHYGLPAGRVEKNESFRAAAAREAKEEVGVDLTAAELVPTLTVHRDSQDLGGWVEIYFTALSWSGEPYNAEPAKHSELAWLDIDNLPENLMPGLNYCLQQIKDKQSYAEYGWDETD